MEVILVPKTIKNDQFCDPKCIGPELDGKWPVPTWETFIVSPQQLVNRFVWEFFPPVRIVPLFLGKVLNGFLLSWAEKLNKTPN